MRPTRAIRALCPDFPADADADPIFADWCEERGLDEAAWVLHHPGTVSRSQAKALCAHVGYTGRKLRLEAVDPGQEVQLHNNYWDEGGRSYWWQVQCLDDGMVGGIGNTAYRYPDGHPVYDRPQVSPTVGDSFVLVEHVIFRGKDLGLHIYGTPATLRRLFDAQPARKVRA